MFKEIIKGIYRDKFARIAFLVLAFIYFCLFFADIIAPYTKDYTDRQLSYVPPSPVFTIDEKGKFSRPYTYNYKREYDAELMQTVFKLDRSKKYYLKFFARGEEYDFLGAIPMDRHLVTVDSDGRL